MNIRLLKMFKLIQKILFIVGVFIVFFGIYYNYIVSKTSDWPAVEGVIEKSYVDKYYSDGKSRYRAKVSYVFKVSQSEYKGSRVSYGNIVNKKYANKVVEKYPQGEIVKVYYSPTDPSDSVLEPGANIVVMAYPVLGVIFVCFSLLLLRFGPIVFDRLGLLTKE